MDTPTPPPAHISENLEAQINVALARENLQAAQYTSVLIGSRLRPCHMYPVSLDHDGLRWVCKYLGCDLAVAYGESPAGAFLAFDNMWMGLNDNSPVDG